MPNNKPIKLEDGTVLTPVEPHANLDFGNIDIPIHTPNINLEKLSQNATRQLDNLQTYKDRVDYANKVFSKGSFLHDFLIAVSGGIVVLAIEHWNDIYNFIMSLIEKSR